MLSPGFRRKAFRAAVAAAGYRSVSRWAAAHGKNENQVYMCLSRRRSDPGTLLLIDSFIIKTMRPFLDEVSRALYDEPDEGNDGEKKPAKKKKIA